MYYSRCQSAHNQGKADWSSQRNVRMPETTRISRSHNHGQGIPKKCSDVREHEDKSFAIARAQKECHVHGFLLDSASSVLYRMEQRYD